MSPLIPRTAFNMAIHSGHTYRPSRHTPGLGCAPQPKQMHGEGRHRPQHAAKKEDGGRNEKQAGRKETLATLTRSQRVRTSQAYLDFGVYDLDGHIQYAIIVLNELGTVDLSGNLHMETVVRQGKAGATRSANDNSKI